MAQVAQINYSDALQGRIRRQPSRSNSPLTGYLSAQGATYRGSNEFVDPELELAEDDHFNNIVQIIASARRQGHDGIEIRLTRASFDAIAGRIAHLAALEDVEIETKFWGEHRGKEQVTVLFRERRIDWLLQQAKATLPPDEFAELEALLRQRIARSTREIQLTQKALGQAAEE